MKLSVLISVYSKENPLYLDQALSSIENQTCCVGQVVLVKDGVLTEELDAVIASHQKKHNTLYEIIALKQNVGLGKALNEGLKHCQYEWVARMDTDDIAISDRLEKQLRFLEQNPGVDIIGGWICEFDENLAEMCTRERRVPALHDEIVRYARYRNPMNHMTVMFRKQAVQDVGGYQHMPGFEDYFLWMRMIQYGHRFANIQQVLVKVRAGRGMISRRQGLQYAKDELRLEKAAYAIGFWGKADIARNVFTRVLPRLLPVSVVGLLYNFLRKT